jgi:hypothetical protein
MAFYTLCNNCNLLLRLRGCDDDRNYGDDDEFDDCLIYVYYCGLIYVYYCGLIYVYYYGLIYVYYYGLIYVYYYGLIYVYYYVPFFCGRFFFVCICLVEEKNIPLPLTGSVTVYEMMKYK